jgi:hypothetical protein
MMNTPESTYTVKGHYGSCYNAGTVDVIDANLSYLARWSPGHPDIDPLLEARQIALACEKANDSCP